MKYTCSLCEREVSYITYHHLTPKAEGGKHAEQVPLCQPCHSTIHRTYSNKELAKGFNTLQILKTSEKLQNYLTWIKKQTIERIKNR
jgi:hypothetical protein